MPVPGERRKARFPLALVKRWQVRGERRRSSPRRAVNFKPARNKTVIAALSMLIQARKSLKTVCELLTKNDKFGLKF
jgi:hypothetical protein